VLSVCNIGLLVVGLFYDVGFATSSRWSRQRWRLYWCQQVFNVYCCETSK